MDHVHVAPAWAGTLALGVPPGGQDPAPLDIGILFMLAGEIADRMPGRAGVGYDPEAAEGLLRAMMATPDLPRMIVEIPVPTVMRTLSLRRSAAIESSVVRLRPMTNRGDPLFEAVEVGGKLLRCVVANSPALLEAHRCFGRPMRGRRDTASADRTFVGLAPARAAAFGSASTGPVYARMQAWLRAPGSAGLPETRAERDPATGTLTLRLRSADVARYLGLWTNRLRPSAIRPILERVEADLAGIGYAFAARWTADGETCVVTCRVDRESMPDPVSEDVNFLGIQEGASPRTGRWRPMASAERKARDVDLEAAKARRREPPEPVAAAVSRTPPRRMSAVIVPAAEPASAITHEDDVKLVSVAEPSVARPAVAVERPAAPDMSAALALAGEAPGDGVVDDYDYSEPPEGTRYPRDGLGFDRDSEGRLRGASEDLPHLDEHDQGFDFARPERGGPALVWPVEHVTGPAHTVDDRRPSWLVRHLPFQVPWWPGAWASRALTYEPAGAMDPVALWAPGMGAQPAHLVDAAQVAAAQVYARVRSAWVEVEMFKAAHPDLDPREDETLWSDVDEADYDLAVRLLGDDPEPWDADRVMPYLSPRDRAYALRVEARRAKARAAARADQLARLAARAGTPVATAAR